LRTNILEGDDGAIMAWFGWESMAKGFTILLFQRDTIEVSLDIEWAKRCRGIRRRSPSHPSPV
jgi:hypothetical protein